jgi:hypothetical protein
MGVLPIYVSRPMRSSADQHIDKLAKKYLGVDKYPGPKDYPGQKRVILKIKPERVLYQPPPQR